MKYRCYLYCRLNTGMGNPRGCVPEEDKGIKCEVQRPYGTLQGKIKISGAERAKGNDERKVLLQQDIAKHLADYSWEST